MPDITLTEIIAGLSGDDIFIIDTDNGQGTDYTTVEGALSNEGGAGRFFVMPGSYSPSNKLSLSAGQQLIGIGNPTITGTTIEVPSNNCLLSGFTLTGNKLDDLDATTLDVGGNSCRLEELVIENRRIEITGNRARIIDCEVLGGITDTYTDSTAISADTHEIQHEGDYALIDQCFIDSGGSIGGGGSSPLTGENHLI